MSQHNTTKVCDIQISICLEILILKIQKQREDTVTVQVCDRQISIWASVFETARTVANQNK